MTFARLLPTLLATAYLSSCAANSPDATSRPVPADARPEPTVASAAPPPTPEVAAPRPVPDTVPPEIEGHFEAALRGFNPRTSCPDFDYFPQGGIRNYWCHRPTSLTLASIHKLAGVDLFASGPHGADSLNLDSRFAFGHYNPAFVRWLVESFAPTPRDSRIDKHTQIAYDTSIRPLAEVFFRTLTKIRREPGCFEKEKSLYERAIAKKTLPKGYYERWFFFMNPFFCERSARGAKDDAFYFDNGFDGGVEGNVTKTVVGFWLRRSMDGTFDTFAEGLKKLIAAYEPQLLASELRTPDGAALTRAFETAVAAASTCRQPGTLPTVWVEVVFSANGTAQGKMMATAEAGTPLAKCVEARLGAMTVPPWDGGELRFRREIKLR